MRTKEAGLDLSKALGRSRVRSSPPTVMPMVLKQRIMMQLLRLRMMLRITIQILLAMKIRNIVTEAAAKTETEARKASRSRKITARMNPSGALTMDSNGMILESRAPLTIRMTASSGIREIEQMAAGTKLKQEMIIGTRPEQRNTIGTRQAQGTRIGMESV